VTTLGQYRGVVADALGHYNTAGRPGEVFYRANLPRVGLADTAAITSAVMTSVPVWLEAGDTVTNLTFISAGTGAGTPTHWWFALYSSASTPALMAQSADQLTGAWAADTAKTVALSTPQKITTSGIYRAAITVVATTVPTLVGTVGAKSVLAGEVDLAQTSGTGLTGTAPATIATPAFSRIVPLVIVT